VKAVIVAIVIMVITMGCSTTKGRVFLGDLDLRTPEQIQAQVPEKTIIYGDTVPQVTTQAVESITPWSLIVDLLKVVKGRLTIVSVEWRVNEPKK
jgi:hypothetical protein